MRWDEIDLAAAWWTIPATKAKNKRAHRVPLSEPALAVLKRARELNTSTATAFPSPLGDGPMIENAMSRAVLRNRETFAVFVRSVTGSAVAVVERFTPHDLRRTGASQIAGMGIARLVVSKLLNHAEPGVTAVYDLHSYDAEKRQALELWGRRLLEFGLAEAIEGPRDANGDAGDAGSSNESQRPAG